MAKSILDWYQYDYKDASSSQEQEYDDGASQEQEAPPHINQEVDIQREKQLPKIEINIVDERKIKVYSAMGYNKVVDQKMQELCALISMENCDVAKVERLKSELRIIIDKMAGIVSEL